MDNIKHKELNNGGINFEHLKSRLKTPVKTTARCEHQEMMGVIIKSDYAPKKYQPRWARWIKQSGINLVDLERLIHIANALPKTYSPLGFVRNRLINKDWIKYFN